MMSPRPPTSTLFPYTTLFRSLYDQINFTRLAYVSQIMEHNGGATAASSIINRGPAGDPLNQLAAQSTPKTYRSEEHTSELQSHVNLVCRLLLEKKKNVE